MYVAERKLAPDISEEPVDHPDTPPFFTDFDNGRYVSNRPPN